MDYTTAQYSVDGSYVDEDPDTGTLGTLGTAFDKNAIQEEIIHAIEEEGIVPSSSDNTQLAQALVLIKNTLLDYIMRRAVEYGKFVGELFYLLDVREPVEYSAGSEDDYFPAICISNIDTYLDISPTNYPRLVPYLRARKLIYKEGLSLESSSFDVTNWSTNSAIPFATLTFLNNTKNVALLAGLLEEKECNGSFSSWLPITLPNSIGNIPAGEYAIASIDLVARTIGFFTPVVTGSGVVTASVEFYLHRIVGNSSSARLYSARGRTIHAANDDNNYFLSGGMRRRGFIQDHAHHLAFNTGAGANTTYPGAGNGTLQATTSTVAVRNVTQGTVPVAPRVASDTNGPAITGHLYLFAGRYQV